MDLMLNELSVAGQFFNPNELREAIRKVMVMRSAAKKSGVEVYCHRNVSSITVASGEMLGAKLQQVLPRNEKRAVFSWMDKHGPFWEDAQTHDPNEWFECDGEIVTDTGLAEAAHCVEIGIDRRMVSFAPSSWERSPIVVIHRDGGTANRIPLANYWSKTELEQALIKSDPAPASWEDLKEISRRKFHSLTFTTDCFADMSGRPFHPGVAERIQTRLNVLDRICANGPDSPEGKKLLADHFGGKRAWFSNSSESEINESKDRFIFRLNGGTVFAPWHGKINNPPYRIHFTWPVSDGKVHVVYVGWHR